MQEFNDLRKNARLVAGTVRRGDNLSPQPSPTAPQNLLSLLAPRSFRQIENLQSPKAIPTTSITTHPLPPTTMPRVRPPPFRCLASLPPRHRPHHRRRHVPAQGGVTPARAAMPASAPPGSVPESCFSQAFSGTPSRAQVFLKSSPGRRPEPGFFPSRLRDAVPGPYVFQVTPGTASGARLGPHEVTAFLWKSTT